MRASTYNDSVIPGFAASVPVNLRFAFESFLASLEQR